MNNIINLKDCPHTLLIVPVGNTIVMPIKKSIDAVIEPTFVEDNIKQFQINGIIGIVGILNPFISTINQIERTGVAARITGIARSEKRPYVMSIEPFTRIKINNVPTDYRRPFSSVEYINDSVKDTKLLKQNKAILENLLKKLKGYFPEMVKVLNEIPSPVEYSLYVDSVINYLIPEPVFKQGLLNSYDLAERVMNLNRILINYIKNRESIVKKSTLDNSKKSPPDSQTAPPPIPPLENITSAFDDPPAELKTLAKKLEETDFSPEAKIEAEREFLALRNTSSISSEYGVSLKFLNWLIRIPWNIKSPENSDIKNAAKILDDSHYGMEDVKNRIIENLAVTSLNPEQKGKILCFVGPPGTGKTSISKAIANAMGRKFARFSVGGMRDEAEIKGHRRTYVGALPGKFTSLLAECGTRNPVITIDEIDKMTSNSQGNPSAALLELLDPEQNSHFIDHYFGEIPIDASDVFFITTANGLGTIEPALLDRLEIIEVHSYTRLEKTEIAKSFLIPKQLVSNGIAGQKISFSNDAIAHLISGYTREAGVRKLEIVISDVCRKTATSIVLSKSCDKKIDEKIIESLLGPPTFRNENIFELEIGEVKGLAWTAYGGQLQIIQAIKTFNTSTIEKTGSLGDVIKESIITALNLVVNITDKEKGEKDLTLRKYGLQIHAPAGATPKDGPSAGITIFTAIYSALTGKKVSPFIAMTGEIDAMGNVLPVGGLKEKIIAAHKEGIKKVILSSMNEGDKGLINLPTEVKEKIEIVYVKKIDEVLEHAIIKE